MRVLYHHRIRSKDGQYVHVEEVIRALTSLGHEVKVVGPLDLEQEDFGGESAALAWVRQRLPHWLHEVFEFAYCLLDWCRLVVTIALYKPDVIYERYNLFLPSGVWARNLWRVPLFLEVNAPLFEERSEHGGVGLRRLARWTQEYTWRGATRCFPVTGVLAGYLLKAGVPENRIVVIPNAINEETFAGDELCGDSRQLLPASFRNATILGFVGFVRSWHGIDKLVELIAHPDLAVERMTLLIVGDGPARQALEQQARDLGVSARVHFTGTVPRAQIGLHIQTFDIALQPKVVTYASPLKLFEYLAMGRAIVAPDVPNIREVLTDGKNALLFDENDTESLKRVVLRLASDPSLRRRLGEAARRTISEHGYTWIRNAERISLAFEEALRAAPSVVSSRDA